MGTGVILLGGGGLGGGGGETYDGLASRPGGVAVLLAMLHDKETVINSSCFGPLASVRFYILPFTCCK